MMKQIFCAVVCGLAMGAIPCHAANSPWDGTWKLNQAKSSMAGQTFTITQDGNMYDVNTGAIQFKYGCDGKDYPVFADRSIVCNGGGNSFTDVVKIGGKDYSTTKREISADGKSMTEVETGTHPDGTAFTDHRSYRRVGGGHGFAGTWKSTAVKSSAPDTFLLEVRGDVLHFDSPGFKEVSDAKLDGTPAEIKGPTAPAGLMISNKSDGPNKVATTVSLNGKELGKDVMTLSADGRTITDVSWTPGKESEKQTAVYQKQ